MNLTHITCHWYPWQWNQKWHLQPFYHRLDLSLSPWELYVKLLNSWPFHRAVSFSPTRNLCKRFLPTYRNHVHCCLAARTHALGSPSCSCLGFEPERNHSLLIKSSSCRGHTLAPPGASEWVRCSWNLSLALLASALYRWWFFFLNLCIFLFDLNL